MASNRNPGAGGRAARCGAAGKDLDNDHAAAAARARQAMIGRGVRISGVVHCRRIQPLPLEQPSTAWQTQPPMRQDADLGHDKGDAQSGGDQGRRGVALESARAAAIAPRCSGNTGTSLPLRGLGRPAPHYEFDQNY